MHTPFRLTPLTSCLAAALALSSPLAAAVNRTVTNCGNTGAGSLRAAVAAAGSGDTVMFDTGQMNCSTITLTTGQIEINVDELTLQGPTDSTLTIGGFHASRVFFHYSANRNRKLTINNLTIANGTVEDALPYTTLQGGCILSSGDVILSGTTVTGCLARNNIADSGHALGGGVSSYKLHMQNSIISDNQATGGVGFNIGGGAFVQDEIVVRSSTISGNKSSGPGFPGYASGGGLGSQAFSSGSGSIQIVSSTIANNESDFGGGVVVFDGESARTITVDHSTVSSNKAHRYAGGIFVYHYAANAYMTVKIVDSTISGNRSYGPVGGVYNQGYLTVSNSTIAFNRADTDVVNITYHLAAGLSTTVAATLQSSIIANNTLGVSTGSDFNGLLGPSITGSNNLIMVTLAGTTAPPGTLTADPILAALTNNGGPTLTHALLGGSPALGTGNNLAHLPSDQRGPGFARSTAGMTDIGAFQSGDGIFYSGFE